MPIRFILLPLFVEVALTFFLLYWMGFSRVASVRRREARIADIALGQPNWPTRVQQISNSYCSQFEIPVLFYLITVLAIMTRHADFLFVVLSWLFVATRLVHAAVHTTSNYVPRRFYAFLAGTVVLLVTWIVFAVRILAGLP